ncbi:MAG: adenosylcobalamin-dependent ribonucleoside-diphosphate reductase [bacterium]|nr:adenosylcobalamin-dependent ribonucleoside-diphosphate reductase [bacterium]
MKYTYDEALKASKDYFYGNDLSARVFVDKYALKDNEGNYRELTPNDMHDRLAKEFAKIDVNYGDDYEERSQVYRNALDRFERIVPQGSPMSAIGNPYQKMSASNCVVVDSPTDDMGGIIETGKQLAQLFKRRCGAGLDLSTLRPSGAMVNNAARTTSGAWSFADFYSYITRMVGQSGRRGALMVTLSVHHPDVLQFATMKQDKKKVTGANISLRLSDEFLQAVEDDTDYQIRWPVDSDNPTISKMIRAREVWDVIVESATETAEPGLLMWDNITNNLPAHCYDDFFSLSTNPCGEVPLSSFDSCRLISINLTGYVRCAFEQSALFDIAAFQKDVDLAQHMADNLVDIEISLIDKILTVCEEDEKIIWGKLKKAGLNGRRTGVGTHGLSDCLAQLCIRYDSVEACSMVDDIYKTLRNQAYNTSIELAKTRGPFLAYDEEKEKKCKFIKRLPRSIKDKMHEYGRRNISLLTQAPTGSVSIMSKVGGFNRYNVSSGVEPVFRNSYTRRKKINPGENSAQVDYVDAMGDSWQEFTVFHSNVSNYFDKCVSDDLHKLPDYFVTSDQIDWTKRVELQGIEQQYIDHSISNTVNLPRGTKAAVVGGLYLAAWKAGLKGVTVYVDGSRDGVLISDEEALIDAEGRPTKIIHTESPKRPKELYTEIHHATVKGIKWTVLIGLLHNEPYELFMGQSDSFDLQVKHKEGKLIKLNGGLYSLLDLTNNVLIADVIKAANNDEGAWTTRMMSMSLRHGIPIEYLVEQLSKDGSIVDVNMVLSRLLRKYMKKKNASAEVCPQCGGNLIYEDGCKRCLDCSYSGCQ